MTYTFRKKPIEIQAIRWTGDNLDELRAFVPEECRENRVGAPMGIRTLEGVMLISHGDWIIKGIKGEFYPCKDEIFRKTYDCMTCSGTGLVFVDCDDPQCGDSTWDHECNAGSDPCPACSEAK